MKNPIQKSLLLIFVSCLMACSSNKQIVKSTNQLSSQEEVQYNWMAMHYYSMAEAALQQNDLGNAIALLKKAEEEDPQNIYFKEKIIETLAQKARLDSTYHDLIIELGNQYYQSKLYNADILKQLAESYRIKNNYSEAERFLNVALELEPSMHLYLAYFFFKKSYQGVTDTLLLDKALEYPMISQMDVINLSGQLKKISPVKNITLLEKAYEKWKDERILSILLQAYDDNNQNLLIQELIRKRISDGDPVEDNLKLYLLASYFSTGKFDEIVKLKNLCFELNTVEALRFLFISALNVSDYNLIIKSGLALTENPELPEEFEALLHAYMGYAYYVRDDFTEAVSHLRKKISPDLLMEIFQNFIVTGKEDNYGKLIDFCEQYTTTWNSEMAEFIAGYALGIADKHDLAKKHLNRVSNSFLKDNDLLLTASITYLDSYNDTLKAKILLDLRTDKDPSAEEVFAVFYYNMEADSIAYEYFKQVLNKEAIPDVEIFMLASILAERMNDLDTLMPELERSLELYPENPEVLNMVGYTIAKNNLTNRFSQAKLVLEKALELSPDNAMIWDSFAWLYYQMGNYKKAYEAMEIPLSQDIKNSEIAYHIAEIYLKLGNMGKAREYFALAIELDNDTDSVELSIQVLETLEE